MYSPFFYNNIIIWQSYYIYIYTYTGNRVENVKISVYLAREQHLIIIIIISLANLRAALILFSLTSPIVYVYFYYLSPLRPLGLRLYM